jgi:class 3 adenylate cyclase
MSSIEQATVQLPAGTVTFLLTDVEGSTRLWESASEAMGAAIRRHYQLLDAAVALHGGVRPQEQGEGDSVVAAFTRASDALAAALDIQCTFGRERWPEGASLKLRMALHTAEAQLRNDGNYFGPALNRCARLRAAAHGGQVVLSGTTRGLVLDVLPEGVELADLGMHRLRDLGRLEHVFGIVHSELPAAFPPLRSLDTLLSNLPGGADQLRGALHGIGSGWAAARAGAVADADRCGWLRQDPAGAAGGG